MYISVENPRAFLHGVKNNRAMAAAMQEICMYKRYGASYRVKTIPPNDTPQVIGHYPDSELVYSVDENGVHYDHSGLSATPEDVQNKLQTDIGRILAAEKRGRLPQSLKRFLAHHPREISIYTDDKLTK